MEILDVRVFERLLDGESIARVDAEELADQVDGFFAGAGEHLVEGLLLGDVDLAEDVPREVRFEGLDVFRRGLSREFEDFLDLVERAVAGEDRAVRDELAHDAADAPHVDGFGVLRGAEEDFRCAVPTRRHVFRADWVVFVVGDGDGARESEVRELHEALAVQQDVRRFQVAVDEFAGVDVLHRFQDLVHHVLLVDFFEDVRADHRVQVRLHEIEHHVQVLVVLRLDDVAQANDVLVPVQFLQEHHLAERPLRVRRIVERVEHFLQRDYLLRLLAERLPHDPIRSFPELLNYLELPQDMWLNVFVAHRFASLFFSLYIYIHTLNVNQSPHSKNISNQLSDRTNNTRNQTQTYLLNASFPPSLSPACLLLLCCIGCLLPDNPKRKSPGWMVCLL